MTNPPAGIQMPSAMSQLGLSGSVTFDDLAERRKKLLSAGSDGDPMSRFGDSAFALLGLSPSSGR